MVVLFDTNRVLRWMLPIVKFKKKSRTGPCGPHGCEEEKRQRKSGREPRVEVKVGKGFFQRFLAMDLSMIDDNCFLLRIMTQKSGDSLNEAGLNVNGRQRGVLEDNWQAGQRQAGQAGKRFWRQLCRGGQRQNATNSEKQSLSCFLDHNELYFQTMTLSL